MSLDEHTTESTGHAPGTEAIEAGPSSQHGAPDGAAPAGGTEQDGSDGTERPREIGGREGPEPTRYGDWEKNGRCIDF